MVSAATILCWSRRTCRLTLFVSDSCRGGNYDGNSVKKRSGGAAATETEVVVRGSDRNRGKDGGNIEAAAPSAEK
jgi:hypothetical protein